MSNVWEKVYQPKKKKIMREREWEKKKILLLSFFFIYGGGWKWLGKTIFYLFNLAKI